MTRCGLALVLLVALAGCHKEAPECAGGKRCEVGYVVKTCIKNMKAYPNDCDELEASGLELTCHTPVMVKGGLQDVRDYCAKDPTYVAPVVTWGERFTQAGAVLIAIVIALITGARTRRIQARKRELGIYDIDRDG